MTSIVSYRKVSTPYTTIQMQLPDAMGADDSVYCTELCTLDGVTYVSVPDGVTLPDQPPELTIEPVTLTPQLREAIKAASPHAQLIAERIIQQIRGRYTLDDELYYARLAGGISTGLYAPTPDEMAEVAEYGAFVEGVRQWGRDERAKLGL
jgi:hypothetical protein